MSIVGVFRAIPELAPARTKYCEHRCTKTKRAAARFSAGQGLLCDWRMPMDPACRQAGTEWASLSCEHHIANIWLVVDAMPPHPEQSWASNHWEADWT